MKIRHSTTVVEKRSYSTSTAAVHCNHGRYGATVGIKYMRDKYKKFKPDRSVYPDKL